MSWSDLTNKQRHMVLHREEILAVWRISRALDSVFPTKCENPVYVPVSSLDPKPCQHCQVLYKNHTFQVTLR